MTWTAALLPLHMGPLHAGEAYAMTVFALGPFVVLALVIAMISRRDRRAEQDQQPPTRRVSPARSRSDRTGR